MKHVYRIEFDRDHSRVPDRELDLIRVNAGTRFGGYTESEVRRGRAYAKGSTVIEAGRQLAIIADNARLVREFAAHVCIKLNQESVVFILPDGSVEFISADQRDGSDIGESRPTYDGHG
jgi:hypothetical protein